MPWGHSHAVNPATKGSRFNSLRGPDLAAADQPRPIVDAHIQYSHDTWEAVPPPEAVAVLRQAGVKKAFVSSSSGDGTQMLLEEAPDLIVPVLRPYRRRGEIGTWVRDPSIVPHVEARLETNTYAGIGEFHVLGADAGLPVTPFVVSRPPVPPPFEDESRSGRTFLRHYRCRRRAPSPEGLIRARGSDSVAIGARRLPWGLRGIPAVLEPPRARQRRRLGWGRRPATNTFKGNPLVLLPQSSRAGQNRSA